MNALPATRAPGTFEVDQRPCAPQVLFEPLLERLRADAATLFGHADVRLRAVGFEDRPFSQLMRVEVRRAGKAMPEGHLFIKVFKHKSDLEFAALSARVARDFETTRRIYEFMSRWSGLGAVRPIACYPESLAIVTEQTDGPTLLAHLHAHAAWFPDARTLEALEARTSAVGRWLRVFQSIDESGARFSLEGLREYVDIRLKRLVACATGRFRSSDRARVLRHIELLGAQVLPGDLREVPVHADMAPGNVLLSGERIVVLDFAMTHSGSIFHDLARFHLQLDLLRLKPQFRSGVVGRLQRALLRGFDPDLAPDRALFRLLLMQHRVTHFTTLSVRPERFPASVYNWHVRRCHRRWIAAQVLSGAAEAP